MYLQKHHECHSTNDKLVPADGDFISVNIGAVRKARLNYLTSIVAPFSSFHLASNISPKNVLRCFLTPPFSERAP